MLLLFIISTDYYLPQIKAHSKTLHCFSKSFVLFSFDLQLLSYLFLIIFIFYLLLLLLLLLTLSFYLALVTVYYTLEKCSVVLKPSLRLPRVYIH